MYHSTYSWLSTKGYNQILNWISIAPCRGKEIFEEMQGAAKRFFVWADERFLNVEAEVNDQNDIVYATSLENICENVKTHFNRHKPTGKMVWVMLLLNCSN